MSSSQPITVKQCKLKKKNSAANQKSAEIRKVLNPPSLLKLIYFNTQQLFRSNSSRGVMGSTPGSGSRDLGFDPPRGKKAFCYSPSCILFAAFLQFCLNMKYLFSKIVLIPAKFPGILSYFILKIQIRPWSCIGPFFYWLILYKWLWTTLMSITSKNEIYTYFCALLNTFMLWNLQFLVTSSVLIHNCT